MDLYSNLLYRAEKKINKGYLLNCFLNNMQVQKKVTSLKLTKEPPSIWQTECREIEKGRKRMQTTIPFSTKQGKTAEKEKKKRNEGIAPMLLPPFQLLLVLHTPCRLTVFFAATRKRKEGINQFVAVLTTRTIHSLIMYALHRPCLLLPRSISSNISPETHVSLASPFSPFTLEFDVDHFADNDLFLSLSALKTRQRNTLRIQISPVKFLFFPGHTHTHTHTHTKVLIGQDG